MTQMNIGGNQRNVREASFDTVKEDWNEYQLESGSRVRVKVIVHKIFLMLDAEGKPAFTDEGDPEVAVRHPIQVVASGGPGPMDPRKVN